METHHRSVAAGVAFGLSYYVGRSMTSTTLAAALMGGVRLGFAVLFFVRRSPSARLSGMFDGWMLGVHFIVLLTVVPLGSCHRRP